MARQPDIQYVRFYTQGSAARKLAPPAPLKTIKLPKIKLNKDITLHIDPLALAGIAMAIVMLVLMVQGITGLHSARQQTETMTAYVQTLQEENLQLQQTFSQGYDLEQIERTALALGFVPKEQVQHVTVQIPPQVVEQEPGTWERLRTFLTGLFA